MEPFNYFLLLIISYSGLFIGLILPRVAFEELNDGRKYFLIMQLLLMIILINILIYYYNTLIFVITGILMVALIFILKYVLKNRVYVIDYLVLGVLFYYSSVDQTIMLINSAGIFLYGFPTASLIILNSNINKKTEVFNKKIIKKILRYSGMVIIAALIYLFSLV